MSGLPKIILMAPRIFYGLALFFAALNILLPLMEIGAAGYSSTLGATEGAIWRLAMARVVERAVYNALFIAGMGVSAQILLAIWRNTHPDRPRAGEADQ